MLVLANVAVAERRPGQHVHRALAGPVGLAAAGPLDDLRPLVLGDHALELDQQRVLRGVGARPLDEHHAGAGLGELLDQQRLVGVLAGQPVRGVDEHHLHRHLGHQVPQLLQRRPHQGGAGMAVIAEHPLLGDIKPQLLGVGAQRRGLRADRLLLLLPGRGHSGVDRRVAHLGDSFLGGCADAPPPFGNQDAVGDRQFRRPMTVEHELASRPIGRSLARMLSTAARQKLLQRLGDHRGDGPPRSGGVRPHPRHQLYWQLDGEHRGRLRHLHRPSGGSALDIPARLALREPEPAGQLTGRIRHPSAGGHQLSCRVDPRGVLVGTSPTTTSHAIKILPNMSHTPRDTRQTLQPAVTQRHLEAEVAHCVGGVVSPILANLFLHYAFDAWMARTFPTIPFERYVDDVVVHCVSERQARYVLAAIGERMRQVGLTLHPEKTRIVYCQDDNRRGRMSTSGSTSWGSDSGNAPRGPRTASCSCRSCPRSANRH